MSEADGKANEKAGPSDLPTDKKMYFEREDPKWCMGSMNEWTKRLLPINLPPTRTKESIFDTCIQLFRCANKELAAVEREFVRIATNELKDLTFEEALDDYRECIFPKIPEPTYDFNMKKIDIRYCLSHAHWAAQPYRTYLARVVSSGCPYKPPLKPFAAKAFAFSMDIVCVLYRCHWYMKFSTYPPYRTHIPDYIGKNTDNALLFIRDYLIIRDFHDFCKKMAITFTFFQRKRNLVGKGAMDK